MSNVVTGVTDVFTQIGGWFTGNLGTLTDVFYTSSGGLTFLGTLGVAALGVSFCLLTLNIIQGFLHFRG